MRVAGCKCGYRDMAHAAECAGVATGAVMLCAVCLRMGGQGPHLSERAGVRGGPSTGLTAFRCLVRQLCACWQCLWRVTVCYL